MKNNGLPELIPCLDVKDPQFDGVVVVTDSVTKLSGVNNNLECLKAPLESYSQVDSSFGKEVTLVDTDVIPSRRLIFSPTGPLNRDYDDVRRFADAGTKGIQRALKAGCKRPLLVRPIDSSFPKAGSVTTLAVLQAVYVPLEIREDVPDKSPKISKLGVWCNDLERVTQGIDLANALEKGRIVTRDIGGSDPERMAAPRVEEYVTSLFRNSSVKVTVHADDGQFQNEYPLLAAVNRAANKVDRHRGRLIFLEYKGEGKVEKTLFLVGKGITYDTGGADIKAGGVMAGMHRDKCGAATVAGFFETLSEMKPKGIKVIGALCMVRNSVGSECYVADEIITSRAGVRVRVGNTDAEGRMVMADVLCKCKEMALDATNPELFTIATLTGHAIRAMGPKYSIIMDNGPARQLNTARSMQEIGDVWGDPFEVSTIRREDFEFHTGKSEYEDILQSNNMASSATARGHQSPSAFLIMSSGLSKHGVDSDKPLPYSHLDIAGSSGPFPGVPTAAPLVAMAAKYIVPRM
ncbi:putative aminopeptidase W07G4.4 isoform X2 [Mizuhopecten yessoensis]|uniref:putative aminopeptidase W07G4.4 isoform X2 n=1 Tax=Mizuhopecten yessoensis TaxID=6573 RepID=UPI000B4579AB|nr:putative aminopeptidase W07G4.4 isoform X2 [Mizuhopecten yessoensis]